jgi:peptidoglycan LD-endopeptidase LytH
MVRRLARLIAVFGLLGLILIIGNAVFRRQTIPEPALVHADQSATPAESVPREAPPALPLPEPAVPVEPIPVEPAPMEPVPTEPIPTESVPLDSTTFPRRLTIPVQGVRAADIHDTFEQTRGTERKHEASDIVAPRGTPVLAADDGMIQKLFLSKAGGITIYQFDPTGQYSYYYAHLERYADGIREGLSVKQGDVIGFVGTSGNAPPDTPHLHFGIFKLGPEKRWYEGTPINPYPLLVPLAR